MSSQTRDYFSSFRSAGRSIAQGEDTTANCIRNKEPLPTPPQIKKYRKSYKQQHGVTIIHPGLVDDSKPPSNFVYGKKSDPSDRVGQLLKTRKEGIQELIVNIQEQNYASHKKEPLAAVPTRNYIWPAATATDGFMFGLKCPPSEYTAKEVVLPPDAVREKEDNRLQYIRSHGNYEAGEQKQRNYSWNLDPMQHRFGKVEEKVQNQMKYVLQQELTQDRFPNTIITKKTQADFKNFHDDPLGQPKNLAQVNPHVTSNTLFGKIKRKEDWNAAQCIRGESTQNEVQPDSDLGKASKSGWRNEPKNGDETRVFGIPTIRNDINKKGMKSVADPQNYGDEKPAVALLFPEKFSHMGLSEEDFLKVRERNEIKSIFEAIGISYGIGKFHAVYHRAKQLQGHEDELVSVSAFQRAVIEMHHIE